MMKQKLWTCDGMVTYLDDRGATVIVRIATPEQAQEILDKAVRIEPADPNRWMGCNIRVNGSLYFRTDEPPKDKAKLPPRKRPATRKKKVAE